MIVLVTTIVGAAAGYAGGYLKSPQYTSEAQLSWDPSAAHYTDSSAYVPDSVSLGQQLQSLTLKVVSDAVVDPVAKSLNMTSEAVRASLDVSVASGATVLLIDAQADSASQSQAIASAVSESFSQNVSTSFGNQYSAQADALQSTIDDLTKQSDGLRITNPLLGSLSGQIATLVAQQDQLKAKAKAPVTPLSVLQKPTEPTKPSSLPPLTLAILGAALGFLIGLAVIALLRLRATSATSRP